MGKMKLPSIDIETGTLDLTKDISVLNRANNHPLMVELNNIFTMESLILAQDER